MKRIAWFLLASLFFVVISGCIVVRRPTIAPPPLRTEVVIAKPGPDFVWISGYWGWKGGRYLWITGRWVKARPGRVWVIGHWERRGLHWVWVKGRWRRR
jgi:hypothetical protein